MRPFILAAVLILSSFAPLAAQGLVLDISLPLLPDQLSYQLAQGPIVSGSESVSADTLLLVPGLDYLLDHRAGAIVLLRFPG